MEKLSQRKRVIARLRDGMYHSSNELRDDLGSKIRNVPQRITEENQSVTLIPEDYPIKKRLLPSNPQDPGSAIVAWYIDTRYALNFGQQEMEMI